MDKTVKFRDSVEYIPPEPPPQSDQNWVDDVYDNIQNSGYDNDEMKVKPKVATLIFENNIRPINLFNPDNLQTVYEDLPIQWVNEENQILTTPNDVFEEYEQYNMHDDTNIPLIDGEIATGNNLIGNENDDYDDEDNAIINSLKSEGLLNSDTSYHPTLNTIPEETKYDMKLFNLGWNDKGCRALRKRYITKDLMKLEDTISKILDNDTPGIYKVQFRMPSQHKSTSAQNDGGANRSVTNQKHLLLNYKDINPYPIGGVKEGEPAIYCTGRGFLPWQASDGEILMVRCYYSPDVGGTIFSPTDIVIQHKERYSAWNMHADVDNGRGIFTLLSRDGVNHSTFDTYMENNLWHHYLHPTQSSTTKTINNSIATVKRLTDMAAYELWHHRLGHPGQKTMSIIHDHAIGVPKLRRNQFYSCASCLSGKFKKTHIGEVKSYQRDSSNEPSETSSQPSEDTSKYKIGQHLHMDFGFVRGSDYCKVDNDGKLVTSVDNYRSYLLVIDKATRYIWIFLTKTKHPPISQVEGLLSKFKHLYPDASITTDQGKELGKSKAFQLLAKEHGYTLKTTGSDSSAQNGLAEKPNQDLARIMRCLLYSAGFDSRYWSYALRHAVYLKNRLPHSALPNYVSPYEKMNGKQPDLSRLKIFGSKVQVKDSGKRRTKLDSISTTGRFMTYKGTDKIAYVTNEDGTHEKASTHLAFDEAHMSASINKQPPMAQALQQAGYRKEPFVDIPDPMPNDTPNTHTIKFKPLSEDATIPQKGTGNAAGYDLFSAENAIIEPFSQKLIHTDLEMEIPTGYGGMIKSRSGLALKHNIDVKAGVIDSDYRGEIGIIIYNGSKENFVIGQGDKIAQILMIPVPTFKEEVVDHLTTTTRGKGGFGSTGSKALDKKQQLTPSPSPIPSPSPLPHLPESQSTAAAATLDGNYTPFDQDDLLPTYNVILSDDPFYNKEKISIDVKGRHNTLGLQLIDSTEWDDSVTIEGCALGTPARKVKDWIQRLKGSTLLQINDTPVISTKQAHDFFKHTLQQKPKPSSITITVDNENKSAIHRDEGIPMMYFDQLAMISSHLKSIQYDKNDQSTPTITKINSSTDIAAYYMDEMAKAFNKHGTINAAKAILPKNKRKSSRLTRRKLKVQDDWNDWKASEIKQLDQYEDQDTFGKPCKLPDGANVLDLLWTYMIKDDGRKKARCVCNGKPSNKNTAVFGYTFAKMLDHVGSRIFWAAAATKNYVVRGADASNAFAEADAPKIPLYVRIDTPYKEWWTQHKNREPIPDNYVLPVKKALQGHPESSRSWAILIDKILREKLHFKPTTHEPCLYYGTFEGQEVLFLRQVDDFAVAAKTDDIAIKIIKAIDAEMTIDIKDLGLLTRYNGVDIVQSRHYIKLNNPTYLKKVLEGHNWMLKEHYIADKPIPMKSENEYSRLLESASPPANEEEQIKLQREMGFNYRQAIGELIYAMITCRPDISYPLIKLSQYSVNPAKEHYEAVKHIFYYVRATIDDGIYYWRKEPQPSLPFLPLPTASSSSQTFNSEDNQDIMIAAVDADWAGDTQHRRSVTGIILRLAGGTILYKTKFQETIAMSSTEAEFAAACDAGKSILYVRSILDEIGIEQDNATTLYIDNNGALMMGNAQQPTRRTRHMDIKKFVLIDWVQHDLLLMKRITTTDNYSDLMTKPLGRTLHWKHSDYIMGRVRPTFTDAYLLHDLTILQAQHNRK